MDVRLGGAEGGMIVGFVNREVELPAAPKPKETLDVLQIRTLFFFFFFLNLQWFLIEDLGCTDLTRSDILKVGGTFFRMEFCVVLWLHTRCLLLWPHSAQRWPMGFAGSVRLGWKEARCMDWGSVITADAFSSSLRRRHAALGFRFLSVNACGGSVCCLGRWIN